MSDANTALPAADAPCTAQGMWQLLHNTTHMQAFLSRVVRSVDAWPGVTDVEDIAGIRDAPAQYTPLQQHVLRTLGGHLQQAEPWAMQFLVLCLVWVLPEARQALQRHTPQKVNTSFFAQFDNRMNQLVFGDSLSATSGHLAHTPLEIVLTVVKELKHAYL